MYGEPEVEIVGNKDGRGQAEIRDFLAKFGLSYDGDVEYSIVLRLEREIVGTGSFAGEILRNIAVDKAKQGEGLTATIITTLMQEQARRGRFHYFIFTKPDKSDLFQALGFKELARAEPYAALLENGLGSVQTYCDSLQKELIQLKKERAAIVVNCNPFTKGHETLIRRAACESEAVIVFVVSEERSLFPFEDRFRLVRDGVAELGNVAVVPAGKYMISAATFPTYFTREEEKVIAQTRLDVMLFATQIAPRLGISTRYIGEEPYCAVTNAYNQAMLEILPRHGISLKLMKRYEIDGEIVSASKVRDMIRDNDWDGIKKMVPSITFNYLTSPEAKDILENIRNSIARH